MLLELGALLLAFVSAFLFFRKTVCFLTALEIPQEIERLRIYFSLVWQDESLLKTNLQEYVLIAETQLPFLSHKFILRIIVPKTISWKMHGEACV